MSSDPTLTTSPSSPAAGWHARATAHPDGAAYAPAADALVFAAIHSTPVEPDGFALALFAPDAAVDARGRALVLAADDWAALAGGARAAVRDAPPSGGWRNQWRVAQPTTSQPIERLLVRRDAGFDEVGVSGYSATHTALKQPVGDITELPRVLYDQFGLVLEGREGYERGQEDAILIGKVKALLGDAL